MTYNVFSGTLNPTLTLVNSYVTPRNKGQYTIGSVKFREF